MSQIGKVISQAIKEGHWLLIDYQSKDSEKTTYWISVLDVCNDKNGAARLEVNMFNTYRSMDVLKGKIFFDSILSATILPFTDYEVPETLEEKLRISSKEYPWLEYDSYRNSLLNYYLDCRHLDNDPSQKEGNFLPGVDVERLLSIGQIPLNEEQEQIVAKSIVEKYGKESEKGMAEYRFAISVVSIEKQGRIYVVCYHNLTFNPLTKYLSIDKELCFNMSFLCRLFPDKPEIVERDRFSLSNYVDMNVNEFIEIFKRDRKEGLDILRGGLKYREYLVDSRNELLILERPFMSSLEKTYQEIEDEYQAGTLPYPLRAFFGNVSRAFYNHARKEPYLVIYDEKTNIDQVLALYNALKYPVTYVQGPPGTGKTQTLINVILSAFFNKRTVLMSSGNNRPVDAIIDKLKFVYKDKIPIPFPWLRLGNKNEMLKALERIKEISRYTTNSKPDPTKLEKIFSDHNSKIEKLLSLLKIYEQKQDIREKGSNLRNFLAVGKLPEEFNSFLEKQLERYITEYKALPTIQNEDVISLCNPVSNDFKFLQFLYFESLNYILKLKLPRYQPLIEICNIDDEKKKVSEFNHWLSDDDNLALLNDVFPIIFCTNMSSARLGTGKYKFDLTIMDEAGQCSISDALLPIARGRSLLILGDQSQLHPIVLLDDTTDAALREKYRIDPSYAYSNNSILTVMKRHDNISKFVFLSYHYRCGEKIISFSNQRYYGKKIKPKSPNGLGSVELHEVENKNAGTSDNYRNACYEEAKAIVSFVKKANMMNTTILCPFVNQVNLINKFLEESGIHEVKAGTIHTMQGAENDTVILSTAISHKTQRRTYEWVKNNSELFNVASTRAKKKFIIYADVKAINALSKGQDDDLSELVKFALKNGNVVVEPNEKYTMEIGYSNNSASEAEFWKTMSHLCSVYPKYTARRNVPESEVFSDRPEASSFKGEFDLVLFERKKPVMAFEINGMEHSVDARTIERDRKKQTLCLEMGFQLVFIGNRDVKDYELIKDLIRNFVRSRHKESNLEE